MTKKLSIITINFNNMQGLINTIESVIRQVNCEYEFIVIDGGSDDGSLEILQKYNNKIDYWVSEPDRGIYHAMNKGVSLAKGDYCNFMNSGDCFYSSLTLDNVFKLNLIEDIYIGNAKTPKRIIQPPINPSLIYFIKNGAINHQAAFIKRSLLVKYPYDEINYKIVSDYNFFFQAFIIENCSYRSIDEFIVNFDGTGISSFNINYIIEEQNKIISSNISPRILLDYTNSCMQYNDNIIVRLSVSIAAKVYKYGIYFIPEKYFRRLKKIISHYLA